MPEPVKTKICPSCGASVDANAETCPFCGFVNEAADEKGFYKDLNASKEKVEGMVDIPEETATKEVRHAGRLIAIVLVVCGVLALAALILAKTLGGSSYHRDEQADYLWLQDNLPVMESIYEKGIATGDFTELLDFYDAARREDAPVWRFDHDAFANRLYSIDRGVPGEIEAVEEIEDKGDSRYVNRMQLLFYDEMELAAIPYNRSLSDEEKEILKPLAEPLVEDLKSRFALSDEELEGFLSTYKEKGYLSYSECERFAEKRIKEK